MKAASVYYYLMGDTTFTRKVAVKETVAREDLRKSLVDEWQSSDDIMRIATQSGEFVSMRKDAILAIGLGEFYPIIGNVNVPEYIL